MSKRRFNVVLIIAVVFLAAAAFAFSPYFRIENIEIYGNEIIPESKIRELLEISESQNIFLFNAGKANKRLQANPYMEHAEFERVFPNGLNVKILERRRCGYIKHRENTFLYIDDSGFALETNSEPLARLPSITGLGIKDIQLGALLNVENTEVLKTVIFYTQTIKKHEFLPYVSYIDVSDAANAAVRVGGIEFNLGDYNDADEKVRTMIQIYNSLPNAEILRGIVDLKVIRSQYICKIVG